MADDRNPNIENESEEMDRTSEEGIVSADDDEFEDVDELGEDAEEIEEE